MSEKSKPPVERFTMLEPRDPNTLPPGVETWPVVEPLIQERFTMLEAKGPNSQPPGVEVLDNGAPAAVPPAVETLLAQLAATIEPLDAPTRAAALRSVKELARRLAG